MRRRSVGPWVLLAPLRLALSLLLALLLALSLLGCGEDPPSDRGIGPADPVEEPAEPRGLPTAEPEAPPEAPPAPEPDPADLLHAIDTTVTVSSAFHGALEQVPRLYDGDLGTAWNGESEDLAGAWIEVTLPADARVDHLELTSGFTRATGGRDLFHGNHRVRRVRVTRDGAEVGTFPLDLESQTLQRIDASGPGGRWRVELVELVPGSHPTWREACVSELRFVGVAPGMAPGERTPTAAISADAPAIDEAVGLPDGAVDLLRAVPTIARTSSVIDFDASRLGAAFDGDLTTGMRARPGDVVGVAIEVELPEDASVARIELSPGAAPEGEPAEHVIRRVRVIHEDVPLGTYELRADEGPLASIPVIGSGGLWRVEVVDAERAARPDGLLVRELRVLGIAEGAEEGSQTPQLELIVSDEGEVDAAARSPVDEAEGIGDDGEPAEVGLALATDPAQGAIFGEAGGLRVTELSLGSAVEDRQIQDARATYSRAADSRIYCLVRLDNPERAPAGIYMAWERVDRDPDDPGRLMNVPASPRYVTFGMTGTRRRAGRYRCAIRTEDEALLGSIAFDLTE